MITKEELVEANGSGYVEHSFMKKSNGKPLIVKLAGRLHTYVRAPHRFIQSAKFGLYRHYRITDENAEEWTLLRKNNND